MVIIALWGGGEGVSHQIRVLGEYVRSQFANVLVPTEKNVPSPPF